ncbi:MAG: O-antigen ligase family protein [Sarcina sp.]
MSRLKNLSKKDFTNAEIINFILYSMIFFMPFIVIKSMKPNYLMGKVIFVYIMGALLLLVLIKDNFKDILALFSKKPSFKNFNLKSFFKSNLEEKGVLLIFISYTIFSLIGPAIMVALLGNKNRYEGLLIYGVYFLLFISAKKYMKVSKKLIEVSCILATLMATLTIVQLHGIDPIYSYLNNVDTAYSEFGTIGNRNFLSTYLLIFETIAMCGFIFFKNKRYLIYSIVIFGGILSGQTRGVWIAFIIMSVFGLFFIFKNKQQLIRMSIIIICFTGVLFGLNFSSKGEILGRMSTLTADIETVSDSLKNPNNDPNNDSNHALAKVGSGRGKIWSMTFRSILQNPIIGTGPDTLHHRLARDLEDEMLLMVATTSTYPDKAHNEFLEYWATGGITTLLGYLTLVGSLLIHLFKRKKDNISKVFILIIVGYLVQSFFNISVIQVAPIYWILLGLATQHYRSSDGILAKTTSNEDEIINI